MATPDFSVVIAIYNGAASLAQTLTGLMAQTCRDFEIVAVDDDSTDHSSEVMQKFMREHPAVRVNFIRHKQNKGLGGARNAGMRAAQGRLIALLDQDDHWYPQKLEIVGRCFVDHSDVSLVTHALQQRTNGEITRFLPATAMRGDVFANLLFRGNHFCGSAMSFRRRLLSEIGFFSENRAQHHLCEDYDYWLRAAAAKLKFHILDDCLGEYVTHHHNFSVSHRGDMFQKERGIVWSHYQRRPQRGFWDPWRLARRFGKSLAKQVWLGVR